MAKWCSCSQSSRDWAGGFIEIKGADAALVFPWTADGDRGNFVSDCGGDFLNGTLALSSGWGGRGESGCLCFPIAFLEGPVIGSA